jgi:hypothetical protein
MTMVLMQGEGTATNSAGVKEAGHKICLNFLGKFKTE